LHDYWGEPHISVKHTIVNSTIMVHVLQCNLHVWQVTTLLQVLKIWVACKGGHLINVLSLSNKKF